MEGDGFADARPSIIRKESGGALAWNRGHLPFMNSLSTYINGRILTSISQLYSNIYLFLFRSYFSDSELATERKSDTIFPF